MKTIRFFPLLSIMLFSFVLYYSCSSDSSKGDKIQGFINHGVLRIDQNKRYFIFEDGTPYVPVGLNNFLIYRNGYEIDSTLRTYSLHGVNYMRIWVGVGADPEIEVGRYDEKQMQGLDSVIYYCKKYGINLNVCFWNENCIRNQNGDWGWNGSKQIYNKEHSALGTTTNADDLRDTLQSDSWNAMKKRYAYFVNRWKDEPVIIMLDLANDCKKSDAWKAGMYDYVKKLDGTGRLVTFQYNTGIDPKGEMDCGSVRIYGYNPKGNDPEVMMSTLADRINEALTHGEPVYVGEGGMDYPEGSEYAFERGFLHFLWAPIAVGAAGNLHSWISPPTWPELSEKKLDYIKCFSNFCKTVKWSEFNSRSISEKVKPDKENIKVFACADAKEVLLYLMNDDSSDKFEPLSVNLNISAELEQGKYRLDWIDIRTGKTISSEKLSGVPANVKSPEFRDGMFAHIYKR